MSKKIIQLLIAIILLVGLVIFGIRSIVADRQMKKLSGEILMDMTITNKATNWAECCSVKPYKLDYIKILSVGFKTDENSFFVKYKLAETLPETDKLPSYNGDRLAGVIFYMSIDQNYFDGDGNVNPSGYEAGLKISFYGDDKEEAENGKITVEGEIVEGGPGYDFFVVEYPRSQIFTLSNVGQIVFNTTVLATTDKYKSGASKYIFENDEYAVAKDQPNNILIELEEMK